MGKGGGGSAAWLRNTRRTGAASPSSSSSSLSLSSSMVARFDGMPRLGPASFGLGAGAPNCPAKLSRPTVPPNCPANC